MSHGADSIKSIMFALGANLAIALSKFGAALYTGSGAMLAEAIHSAADCGNQTLLLWGLKQSRRAPSIDHPLGHGKAIYFWSFVVALMLFSMGGLFSVYEGWHKLHEHEPLHQPWIAIGILSFSIVAESFSLWGCLREIAKVRQGQSLWRWFRDSRQSELIVVLGEDLAALLGLTIALLFVTLAMVTHNPLWDAVGSIGIGILLIIVAIGIGVEIKALLIGQSADPATRAGIHHWLTQQAAVREVFHVITLQNGADLVVAIKARLSPDLSLEQAIDSINRMEVGLKQAFPTIRWVFFEPDNRDD